MTTQSEARLSKLEAVHNLTGPAGCDLAFVYVDGTHICAGPDRGTLTPDEWRDYLAVHGADRAALEATGRIITVEIGGIGVNDICPPWPDIPDAPAVGEPVQDS